MGSLFFSQSVRTATVSGTGIKVYTIVIGVVLVSMLLSGSMWALSTSGRSATTIRKIKAALDVSKIEKRHIGKLGKDPRGSPASGHGNSPLHHGESAKASLPVPLEPAAPTTTSRRNHFSNEGHNVERNRSSQEANGSIEAKSKGIVHKSNINATVNGTIEAKSKDILNKSEINATGCENWRDIQIAPKTFEASAADCGLRCQGTPNCTSFNYQERRCEGEGSLTWGCFLFNGNCKQKHNACYDAYSMTPTSSGQEIVTPANWTYENLSLSIFCFMLVYSSGYEVVLAQHQYNTSTGIWTCDDQIVYSDWPIQLSASYNSTTLGDLTCDLGVGGSWANAWVFVKVWQAVFDDGRWLNHDWVMKVDADTVFHVDRLRQHINASQPEPFEVSYFKTHDDRGYELVGAIEVLSRGATERLSESAVTLCDDLVFDGPAAEDNWLNKCLQRLGVTMENDSIGTMLRNGPHANADGACYDEKTVALHPYKDVGNYSACLNAWRIW